MYHDGQGVPQDFKVAVCWYTKAAEQGAAGAQYNPGLMYHNGKGVPQDSKERSAGTRKLQSKDMPVRSRTPA